MNRPTTGEFQVQRPLEPRSLRESVANGKEQEPVRSTMIAFKAVRRSSCLVVPLAIDQDVAASVTDQPVIPCSSADRAVSFTYGPQGAINRKRGHGPHNGDRLPV